jgi:D-glycero-D-manno-heptose 1,7-bisphosphate phosphatase
VNNLNIIVLDRDGVINQDSANYIKNDNEWIPIPGSLEAIALLNQNNFKVIIATNQSGIGRGLYSVDTLNLIHQKMHRLLAEMGAKIDAIYFCPHTDEDKCNCRKPKPGMFLEIEKTYRVDLNNVYGVGDSLRDLEAFAKANMKMILVKTGNGQKLFKSKKFPKKTKVFKDLSEAVNFIIKS